MVVSPVIASDTLEKNGEGLRTIELPMSERKRVSIALNVNYRRNREEKAVFFLFERELIGNISGFKS